MLVEVFFFSAAAGCGVTAVPLSVHSMYVGEWAAPELSSPLGHAHQLFCGYALAVVTGFMINRMPQSPPGVHERGEETAQQARRPERYRTSRAAHAADR